MFVTFVSTRCQDLGDLGGRRTANRLVIDRARLFVGHKAHNVISARVISVQLLSLTAGNLHAKFPLAIFQFGVTIFSLL